MRNADANAYGNSNRDSYGYANCHAYSNRDSDCERNSNSHSYRNGQRNGYSYADCHAGWMCSSGRLLEKPCGVASKSIAAW